MEGIPGRGSGRESCIGVDRKVKALAAYHSWVVQLSAWKAWSRPFVTEGLPEVPFSRVPEAPDSSPENGNRGICNLSQSDRGEAEGGRRLGHCCAPSGDSSF